jgi:ketosteroid isomerase-like protein
MRIRAILLVTSICVLAIAAVASAADKKRDDQVRMASDQFYAALNRMVNGDASGMANIWSHGASVTTMHPIGGREVGWDKVRGSWEQVAKVASDGKVELRDQLIQVFGDVACEVGIEHAKFKLAGQQVEGDLRVTNIYRREGEAWKIVHHHTDVDPAMVEVVKNLPPQSEQTAK